MKSNGLLNPPFLFMYCLYFLSTFLFDAYKLLPGTCLPAVESNAVNPIICIIICSSVASSMLTGITGFGTGCGFFFFFIVFWTPILPPSVRFCTWLFQGSCTFLEDEAPWLRSPLLSPAGERSLFLLGDLSLFLLLLGDLDLDLRERGERLLLLLLAPIEFQKWSQKNLLRQFWSTGKLIIK